MSEPRIYYPRALVSIEALFDDQVGSTVPAAWTAIPRSVDVRRNSARKADTARIELDYSNFPLDPRLLKAVHVTIHIEAARDPLQPIVPTAANLRFQGIVDEPEATLGPDDERVTFEARDYTAIYLDTPLRTVAREVPGKPGGPPQYRVDTPAGLTLQAFVESIRAQVTPETLPAVFSDLAVARQVLYTRTGRALLPVEQKDSAWDVLAIACDLFGQVPVWEIDPLVGAVLVVRTASESSARSALMVYGQNVERLQLRRNLRKPEDKQVRIVAWNPITGQALEALHPLAVNAGGEDLGADGTPKSTKGQPKRVQYNVEGNYTKPQLEDLAGLVYTEMSQEAMLGELETRDLSDVLDGDLLSLANGDRLICTLGAEVAASIAHLSPFEAVLRLTDPSRPNPMPQGPAQALVDSWQAAQSLSAEFYITEAEHRWDLDDGYRLTIRFRDFVLGGL